MRGDGMNQDYAQNMMQPPYGQVPQNDPYAAYRPMGNTGAYQAPQYPVYPQGNAADGYQMPSQMYPNQYPQYPQYPDPSMQQPVQPAQPAFTGPYNNDYLSSYSDQGMMGSGPVKVPQVSAATGEQIVYNAPMAPAEDHTSIVTPQMAREGLAESPKQHLSRGISKKNILILCAAAAGLILIGVLVYFMFFAGKSAYTAENVVTALYRRGLPIASPVSYTETTDPDGLLGTMNQYTSKVSWTDERISNGSDTLARGGIVEVFASADLAQERLRQLRLMLPVQSGIASQVNRVVMRLSTELSESQVQAYQQALNNMFRK